VKAIAKSGNGNGLVDDYRIGAGRNRDIESVSYAWVGIKKILAFVDLRMYRNGLDAQNQP
jgi:hypothetical protein